MHQQLPVPATSGPGTPPDAGSSLRSLPAKKEKVRQSLLNSLVTHLGRAFADPRTEIAKDRWDLTVLAITAGLRLRAIQAALFVRAIVLFWRPRPLGP